MKYTIHLEDGRILNSTYEKNRDATGLVHNANEDDEYAGVYMEVDGVTIDAEMIRLIQTEYN